MDKSEKAYRRIINSWAMYDWANSAFTTTIMAAFFPPFYRAMAMTAGASANDATAYWGYTTSVALLVIALLGPILGTIGDSRRMKKKMVAFFAGLGVTSSALFVFLGDDSYLLGSTLFILGNIGFAGGNIFYESLLPHVATRGDVDEVSARGYAFGYLGGGLLLAMNVAWYMEPGWFFMPDGGFAVRAAFFSVAVWWGLFAIPLLRTVPEPSLHSGESQPLHPPPPNVLKEAFQRLSHTFGEVAKYRQLLIFLIAFWLYNDGIGTIIKMATAVGSEIGIEMSDLVAAILITQFVGIPCAFAFGKLGKIIGTKRAILVGLLGYTGISIGGYFVQTATHFYILAFLVGTVQGGTQALSRSLFSTMVPKDRAAEFFGFYSTSSRFAGIAGPLIFGIVSQYTGTSRHGIIALTALFISGGILLMTVDEREGRRIALEAERDQT